MEGIEKSPDGNNKKGFKNILTNYKETILGILKRQKIIRKNKKKYPGITRNQAIGREPVIKDGKELYMDGFGELGTPEIDIVTEKNMARHPGITPDQAAGREPVTINGKTGYLDGYGNIGETKIKKAA